MIIRLIFSFAFTVFSPFLYGQNKIANESIILQDDIGPREKEITSTTFYEVETFIPVFKSTVDTAKSPIPDISYYFGEKTLKVSMDISYRDGGKH